MLGDDEMQALADNIRESGQLYPIILDNDSRVVDGRNRLVACRLAGVEPQFEARDLDDTDALALVVSANIPRRHLTESQRADIAAKISNVKPGNRTGSNQHERKPAPVPVSSEGPAVTQAEAARMLNVSERSVRSAAKVQRKGSEELQQAVQDGSVPVKEAARIADLPKAQQTAAVEAAKKPKPRKRPTPAPYDPPRPDRPFDVDAASGRLAQLLRDEIGRWPREHRETAAHWVRAILGEFKL